MFYNLRKIRERQGISQRETARLLKISKSSYNYYETGEYIISLNHLNDFCNKFHVSMDYVVGLTDINTNSNITKRYRINYINHFFIFKIIYQIIIIIDYSSIFNYITHNLIINSIYAIA